MTEYHVCDHPELFIKNNVCHGCMELDGQSDVFSILKTSSKGDKNHDKSIRKW